MPNRRETANNGIAKMLVVHGPGDSGKSTALRQVYQAMLQQGVGACSPLTVQYHYFTKREVGVAIEGKKKFGLLTRGDSAKHVREGLSFLLAQGCTVIVCATRAKGTKSWEEAINFASAHGFTSPSEVQKIKETATARYFLANEEVAKRVASWTRRQLAA